MPNQKHISVISDLEVVELDGELVVLNVDNGHYYGLNKTGARILMMAQQKATLDEVVDALIDEYSVDAETIRQDVLAFLDDMEKHEMLRVEGGAAA